MNVGALSIPASINYADLRVWKTPTQPFAANTAFTFVNPAGYTLAFLSPILVCRIAELGYAVGDEVHPVFNNVTAADGLTIGTDAAAITISTSAVYNLPSPKGAPTTQSNITPANWGVAAYIGGMAQSGALSIPFTSKYVQAFKTDEQNFTATPFTITFGNGPGRRPQLAQAWGLCIAADNGFLPGQVAAICNAAGSGSSCMAICCGADQINLLFTGSAGVLTIPGGGGSPVALTAGKWRFFVTGLA